MEPQNNPQRVFTPEKPTTDVEDKPRGLSSQPYGLPQPESSPQVKPPAPPKPQVSANTASNKWAKLRKGPVIAGIIGGILVVVLLIFALLAGGDKKPNQTQKPAANSSGQAEALQPAQSIELEQTNNSLSQDLSRLDDEKDLPNNSLEDATLGL